MNDVKEFDCAPLGLGVLAPYILPRATPRANDYRPLGALITNRDILVKLLFYRMYQSVNLLKSESTSNNIIQNHLSPKGVLSLAQGETLGLKAHTISSPNGTKSKAIYIN